MKYFQIPQEVLTEVEKEFFDAIRERLDYTAWRSSLDEDEAKYGYMDARQYIEWVREMTKDFLEDQSKWHAKHSRSEYFFRDKDGDKHFT